MTGSGKGIYERKDGRWEGRYISSYNENGRAKYSSVYGRNRDEVESKLTELKNQGKMIYSHDRGNSYFSDTAYKKTEKGVYEALSDDEVTRLINCAKYNVCPEMLGIMLVLFCGIGTGELCALRWNDFDIENREITIHNTIYRVKDKTGSDKKTRLLITNIHRTRMRTVRYPSGLDDYVRTLYKKEMVFLTGTADKYIEQRTLYNHLGVYFSKYGLEHIKVQNVLKTYKNGNVDSGKLINHSELKKEEHYGSAVDEKWLIREMENDLEPLRKIIGISGEEMGMMLDMSESDYKALEAGEENMNWTQFISLLFFFRCNTKTAPLIDVLGLYPESLRYRFNIDS